MLKVGGSLTFFWASTLQNGFHLYCFWCSLPLSFPRSPLPGLGPVIPTYFRNCCFKIKPVSLLIIVNEVSEHDIYLQSYHTHTLKQTAEYWFSCMFYVHKLTISMLTTQRLSHSQHVMQTLCTPKRTSDYVIVKYSAKWPHWENICGHVWKRNIYHNKLEQTVFHNFFLGAVQVSNKSRAYRPLLKQQKSITIFTL